MVLPTLPPDGLNPWGSELRSALIDISNRADQGIANASTAQSDVDDAWDQLDTNATTLTSNTSRISTLETSVATKAADSSVVKLTGNQTISGTKTFNSAPVVPDNSFAIAKVTGLQTALNAKAALDSPAFTGTVSGITKSMVGLSLVDNTADTTKPVSVAQQAALDLKANTSDVNNLIQTHNHTGGVNGVAIPISAVTNLQTSLNAKQPNLAVATGNSSNIDANASAVSIPYIVFSRTGQQAYVYVQFTLKTALSAGNMVNTLIATIKSTSPWFDINPLIPTTQFPNGAQYALSSVADGPSATGFLDSTGRIYLAANAATDTLPVGYTMSLAGTFLLNTAV